MKFFNGRVYTSLCLCSSMGRESGWIGGSLWILEEELEQIWDTSNIKFVDFI